MVARTENPSTAVSEFDRQHGRSVGAGAALPDLHTDDVANRHPYRPIGQAPEHQEIAVDPVGSAGFAADLRSSHAAGTFNTLV